jgi:putative copper resistance protein D
VPTHIEVEAGLALALLLSAAALSALPRAIDVGEAAATPAEVWAMFSPKWPNLHGPEPYIVPAPELTDISTGKLGVKEVDHWSNFNHNLSGVIVIAMALLAWLDRTGHVPWARHWPLMFIGFAAFILLLADPELWPVGSMSILESLYDPEVLQHRLLGFVALGLGIFEWRARTSPLRSTRLLYVFPILCGVGGIVLLTHAHTVFALKQEFLIQVTHVSMGFLAVVMGCMRWLDLRLPPPGNRIAGLASIAAMALIGVLLLFYHEPHWERISSG